MALTLSIWVTATAQSSVSWAGRGAGRGGVWRGGGGGPGPGERPGYRQSLQTRTVVRSRLESDDRTWKIWLPSLQHPPTRPVLLRVCGWWVGGWVCRCGWAPAPERACGALFTRIRPGLMATRPDSTYFLTSIALSQTCPFMLRRYTNPSPT